MRAMADQAAAAADASPTLAPSPGSPRRGDTDALTPHPTGTREDGGSRDGCGLIFTIDGDAKPPPSPQPGGMLLADLPRAPQPRLSPAKSRTAPSSPSVSPSETRAALLRLREARLEDTKKRLSEAVQEPLSRLSRLMAEESGPGPRAKAGAGGLEVGGSRGVGGRRARDWSPWEPTLNCRYEICSYGDVIQVVEVAERDAEARLPPPEEPPAARPGGTAPGRALASIALLAYGYFVLPLPPYAAGLCLGLVCGLVLGFLTILLLIPKAPPAAPGPRGRLCPELVPGERQETHRLQVGEGWSGTGCWVGAGGVPGARGAALRGGRARAGCWLLPRTARREAASSVSTHPGLDEPAAHLRPRAFPPLAHALGARHAGRGRPQALLPQEQRPAPSHLRGGNPRRRLRQPPLLRPDRRQGESGRAKDPPREWGAPPFWGPPVPWPHRRSRRRRSSSVPPAWPESGRGTRSTPSASSSPSWRMRSAGAARSTTRSCRGMKGRGRCRCRARTSPGTAGRGACTSSGGRAGRRRSGTSTWREPPAGHPAAAAAKPGRVRSSRRGLCSAPGWELCGCREDEPLVGSGGRRGRWRRPEARGFAAAGRAWRSPLARTGWVGCHLSHHPDPLVSPCPQGTGAAPRSSGSSSGGSTEDIPCAVPPKELVGSVRQKIFLDYSTYMARLVPAQGVGSPDRSPSRGAPGSPTPAKVSGTNPALGAGHER